MMIRRRYGFRWNSFFRCDHGDEETIDLMAEAGCEGVILGVESGSNRVLHLMNKTARRAHYLKAIPRLEAMGIACYASFIIGFPGETYDTVQESIELLDITRPSYFRAQLWYCDPITPIYRQRLLHGLRGEGFHWSHRTMNVEEACDHIERMSLSVQGSIWQPQAGFEFWSTFYLQRKGMSREQVFTFLRSFNGATKEKLLRPRAGAEISPARARDLQRSSEIGARDPAPLEAPLLSGAEYVAAERYWIQVAKELSSDERTQLVPHEEPELCVVSVTGDTPDTDALLAALTVVAASLQGGWRTLILGQDGSEPELLPLYVDAHPSLRFPELVALVARAREASRPHRAFGMPILRRAIRLAYLGVKPPRIAAAFVEEGSAWPATLAEHPSLGDEVRVLLERGDGGVRLRTRLGAAMTAHLARVVRSALSDGGKRAIDEIASHGVPWVAPITGAEPAFDFG